MASSRGQEKAARYVQEHVTIVISDGTLGYQRFQGGGVFLLQRCLDLLALRIAQSSFRENTTAELELADRQAKIVQTDFLHTLHGNGNHFGIRLRRFQPNQLDSCLIQLLEVTRL